MNRRIGFPLGPVFLVLLLGLPGCLSQSSHPTPDPSGEGEGEGHAGGEGEGEGLPGGEGQAEGEGEGEGLAEGEGEGLAAGEGEGEGEGQAVDPCLEDRTGPRLLHAYSPDGQAVVLRFDEPLDPASGADPARYQLLGNDGSTLRVANSRVDEQLVHLTLAPDAEFQAAVTYLCQVRGLQDRCGRPQEPQLQQARLVRTLHVALLWVQDPLDHHDPVRDQAISPWTRKRATKDYYDMAARLARYPEVHVATSLSPVLLEQLARYLDRLGPAMDWVRNTIDVARWEAHARGRTDPWIDLLMTETPDGVAALDERQRQLWVGTPWSMVSTSAETMKFFPEYARLRDANRQALSREQLLGLKIWFELAWFDPDFLQGPVVLPHDPAIPDEVNRVDLSDLVERDAAGRYTLRPGRLTEQTARRLVAESYKVMRAIVPLYRQLRYSPTTGQGQLELLAAPDHNALIPLLFDSDLARQAVPAADLPGRFHFPLGDGAGEVPAHQQDAYAQVARAVRQYRELFGEAPAGMWPSEAAVAQEVVWAFGDAGLSYVVSDALVLQRSRGPGATPHQPYRLHTPSADTELAILFRDAALSDLIVWDARGRPGEEAAAELIRQLLTVAPRLGGPDRLVVLALDGACCWETFVEHDGHPFLHALYRQLRESGTRGELLTVTPAEYLSGNPERGVAAHPTPEQSPIDQLAAGGWNSTFDPWIGEPEENCGWEALKTTREALRRAAIPCPDPLAPPPRADGDPIAWAAWQTWDALYAAEAGDWFWWLGQDFEQMSGDDTVFDRTFRHYLGQVFTHLRETELLLGRAPAELTPRFDPPPCIVQPASPLRGPFREPDQPQVAWPPAPVLDGRLVPDLTEWIEAGGLLTDLDEPGPPPERFTDDMLEGVFYGYSTEALYVGLQAQVRDLSGQLGQPRALAVYTSQRHILDLATGEVADEPANVLTLGLRPESRVVFPAPGAAREIRVELSGGAPRLVVSRADGRGGWQPVAQHGVQLSPLPEGSNLLELRIPYAALGVTGPRLDPATGQLQVQDPLTFLAAGLREGTLVDVAPDRGPQRIFADATRQVPVTFVLDVLGPQANLAAAGLRPEDLLGQGGQAIPRVLGSAPNLGGWDLERLVNLTDDGTGGDAAAGDGIWSRTIRLERGVIVNYKYLIRANHESAQSWAGEELPSASRGFRVCQDCQGQQLTDAFNSGQAGNHTTGHETVITCQPENCEAEVYCRPQACHAEE